MKKNWQKKSKLRLFVLLLKTIIVNFNVNYRQFKDIFCLG